jgi:hypothetical protein
MVLWPISFGWDQPAVCRTPFGGQAAGRDAKANSNAPKEVGNLPANIAEFRIMVMDRDVLSEPSSAPSYLKMNFLAVENHLVGFPMECRPNRQWVRMAE